MCRRMAGWPIKKVLATPAVASLKSSKSRISKLCGIIVKAKAKQCISTLCLFNTVLSSINVGTLILANLA